MYKVVERSNTFRNIFYNTNRVPIHYGEILPKQFIVALKQFFSETFRPGKMKEFGEKYNYAYKHSGHEYINLETLIGDSFLPTGEWANIDTEFAAFIRGKEDEFLKGTEYMAATEYILDENHKNKRYIPANKVSLRVDFQEDGGYD
jgi:hypothetical protein